LFHGAAAKTPRVRQLFTSLITRAELVLLGSSVADELPTGGQILKVTVCCGSGTAHTWTEMLAPFLRDRYGINVEPGSLNLWADGEILWRQPFTADAGGREWELCPLVLEERAIGVAFRSNRDSPEFLEVLSPVKLRSRLGNAKDGDRIRIRLLSGTDLGPAV